MVQLEGSRVVQAANDRFDATMTNVVTFSSPADAPQGTKQLESNATIQACHWACGAPPLSGPEVLCTRKLELMSSVLIKSTPVFSLCLLPSIW